MTEYLKPEEFNSYYATYIDLVVNKDCVTSLQQSLQETLSFYKSIPEKNGYILMLIKNGQLKRLFST